MRKHIMRNSRLGVYLFCMCLLFVIVIFGKEEAEWDGTVSLSVKILSDDHTEEIKC